MLKNSYQRYLLFSFLVSAFYHLHCITAPKEIEINLTEEDIKNLYEAKNRTDLAIIGSGPAGLSAAIFSARHGIPTYVFTGPNHLGYLKEGLLVENLPGADADSGINVMKKLEKQARHFGAHFIDDTIEGMDLTVWPRKLKGANRDYSAEAVIIATGAKPRSLGVDGESSYTYKGILSCGLCEAHLAKGQDVIIIGGDNATERIFQLLPHAKSITLLLRSGSMNALPSMKKKIKELPTVKILYNQDVVKFLGDGKHLAGIDVLDKQTNKVNYMPTRWVFLSIGYTPNTELFRNHVDLDEDGYIKVDFSTYETSIPLVYAAGNVCDSRYQLAATCLGSATQAAFNATQAITHLPISRDMVEKIKDNAYVSEVSNEQFPIAEVQQENELENIIKNNKFVVADFFVKTCPECRRVGIMLNSLASKYKDRITFIKVDDAKFDTLSKLYTIEYVPSLLFFSNGTMVDKIEDKLTEQQLEQKIKDALNKASL
jgi:thioredoxin reductase (NADPH)